MMCSDWMIYLTKNKKMIFRLLHKYLPVEERRAKWALLLIHRPGNGNANVLGREGARIVPLGNGVKGFVWVDEATVNLTRKGPYIGDRLSKQHCRLHVHLPFVGQAIVLQLKKRNESVRCLSDREAFLRTLPIGYSIIERHYKRWIGPLRQLTRWMIPNLAPPRERSMFPLREQNLISLLSHSWRVVH